MKGLRAAIAALMKGVDWGGRIQTGMSIFFQLAILVIHVGALFEKRWLLAFTSALFFVMTFLPALIARRLRVMIPVEFSLVTCAFLYASFALGEVREFYGRFWWWDIMLHSLSAAVLGIVGFLIVYSFHMTRRIRAAPVYVALFSFGFALTIGTLWEIFEFFMDLGFGLNMQKSGLVDTMTDLIVDSLGGLAAALTGYYYVKGGDSLFADRLVRKFVEHNPGLFPPGDGSGEDAQGGKEMK